MKKLATVFVTAGAIGVMACTQSPGAEENVGAAGQALDAVACGSAFLDDLGRPVGPPEMPVPSAFGHSYDRINYSACWPMPGASSVYRTPAGSTYPGVGGCENEAILENTASTSPVILSVMPQSIPTDQGTCTSTFTGGTVLVKSGDSWVTYRQPYPDTAGKWVYYSYDKQYHCQFGQYGGGEIFRYAEQPTTDLGQYPAFRVVGHAYQLQGNGKGMTTAYVPVSVGAYSQCIY
jgi:hypothetical protein